MSRLLHQLGRESPQALHVPVQCHQQCGLVLAADEDVEWIQISARVQSRTHQEKVNGKELLELSVQLKRY